MMKIAKFVLAAAAVSAAGTGVSSAALSNTFDAGGSSATFLAYNATTSQTIDLGFSFSSFQSDLASLAPGASKDYALGTEFNTTFGASIATTQWGVFGGDANALQLLSTSQASVTQLGSGQIASGIGGAQVFIDAVNNSGCTTASCVTGVASDSWGGDPDSTTDLTFFGNHFGAQTPSLTMTTIGNGSALQVYVLTATSGTFGNVTKLNDTLSLVQLTNGDWVLRATAAGGTAVPLPAALWLLLSGVTGMGAIARRRKVEGDAVDA